MVSYRQLARWEAVAGQPARRLTAPVLMLLCTIETLIEKLLPWQCVVCVVLLRFVFLDSPSSRSDSPVLALVAIDPSCLLWLL
jgi:hypothetical protein